MVIAISVCAVHQAVAQKVGYVSTDAIRKKYEPNKLAEERLVTMVEEWKGEIAKIQMDIDDVELEIKKNRLIWGEQERKSREKDLEDKKAARDKFTRERLEPGGEYDKRAEELFASVWQKIYVATQKVAAAEGYDIVLDKSTQPLIYVNAKYDLTVKVMKELGIDADDMERQQRDVIENDPRNKKIDEPRRRKSRSGSTPPADTTKTPVTPNGQGAPEPKVQDPKMTPVQVPPQNPNPDIPPVDTKKDTTKPRTEEEVPR